MALHSPGVFLPSPAERRRPRRQRVSALLVIAAVASSAFVLQAFHDQQRASYPGAPAAFTYFPN